MKAKAALNSEAMKQFFIAHGEKVAFGLLLALAGWIGYSASQIPVYGEGSTGGFGGGKAKTAEHLWAEVGEVKLNLYGDPAQNRKGSESRMALAEDGIAQPKVKFSDIVERLFLSKLNPAAFGGIEWNRPLRDMKSRRTEPTYLAAQDVRASFHHGAILFGGTTKSVGGEEWICVTALVPNERQTAEFRNAFENAADARAGAIPKYFVYELRRAEVSPNSETAIDWETQGKVIDLAKSVDAVMAAWDGNSRELAEIKYTQWPYLTQPLPPVADPATLGEWVAHIPEIPMFQPGAAAPAEAPANQPAPAPAAGVFGRAVGAPAAPAVVEAPAAAADGAVKPPEYYLLRFFDFDIEPGKAYRYQIRLVLNNPNKGLNRAFLEKPELAEGDYRMAPWSTPSPAAHYPNLEEYFAGSLDAANGDQEPQVSVATRKWSARFGAEIFHEYAKRLRGAVLNTTGADVYFNVPGKPEAASDKEDMNSNAMVVDFSSERVQGRQLTAEGRPINRPCEVLLLSPRGELMIRTQLMHWSYWEEFKGLVSGNPAPGPKPGPGPIPVPPADNRPGPFSLR